jgi:hypothetical protein
VVGAEGFAFCTLQGAIVGRVVDSLLDDQEVLTTKNER